MRKRYACALYLSFLTLPVLAQTTPEPAPDTAPAAAPVETADAVPATVVVEGRRPGPGVWKVSKGDHVMWVFGLYSPLPQKMEWDAGRVERLVARSQEVLLPPGASIEMSWFRELTLLPSMIGMEKNPDGARLRDMLPADVYTRWQVLKGKYIGQDDGIERDRPFFAAEKLLHAGLKKNGLAYSTAVGDQVEKIAKQNKVKVTETMLGIQLDDPKRTLKAFKQMQMADLSCFTKTLERLDGDIDAMRVRANAWANGDITEIARIDYAERDEACGDALLNSPLTKTTPELQNVRERIRAGWLKAAEKSLANNMSSFALLRMKDVVGPTSYLADLRAKGYTVESPK
ncbi:MAG: TraB/GumN family protein [Massilia sp.]